MYNKQKIKVCDLNKEALLEFNKLNYARYFGSWL